MNSKQLLELLKRRFPSENFKILGKKDSYDHKVFFLEKRGRKIVLKIPKRDRSKLLNEARAFRVWHGAGAKVPEVLSLDPKLCFLIETCLGVGMHGEHLKLSGQGIEMIELGKEVKKMHSVKINPSRYFNENRMGKNRSWKEYIDSDFYGNLNSIRKAAFIPEHYLSRLILYYSKNKKLLNLKIISLIHGDLQPDNILVKNGHLIGIVDGADSLIGDPMYDLGFLYKRDYPKEKYFNLFKRGYGKVDMRKIRLYFLTILLFQINFYKIDKNKEEFKRNVMLLKYFINSLIKAHE